MVWPKNQLVDAVWTYSLDAVWAGLAAAVASLLTDCEHRGVASEVGALGVSAMMHGYLASDESGQLLVPFRTWRNTSTGRAAAELSERFGFNVPLRWSVSHYYQAILDDEPHVPTVAYLTTLGVDGFLVSPAYGYTAVQETNPEGAAEIFLTREDIRAKFQEAQKLFARHRMMSSPIYLEFLSGKRELSCTAWGNPTRNVKGWKGPCYLVGKSLTFDWHEFWNNTDWEYWESRKDKLCQNCAMHSGFEASAVMNLGKHKKDLARMAVWNFT